MKVEVISCYYREQCLVPLFMNHYEPWVDKVTLITRKFEDSKINDEIKSRWFNEAISDSTADWVVAVDMDEFVCPKHGVLPREALKMEMGNVIYCRMVVPFRHERDLDIDPTRPPIPQRRHGQTTEKYPTNLKPSVFKPHGASLGIGNQSITIFGGEQRGIEWAGSHWSVADPSFAKPRMLKDRIGRLSETNLSNGWGSHYNGMTSESLDRLFHDHEQDPIVI